MKLLISHESPISLLSTSTSYNDYDYCLVHLMETQESYRDFFLKARNLYDREVFLDTSVFELGKAFDPSKYIDWAEKIRPNLMIIPDVLEDSTETIKSWDNFITDYGSRLDKLDARRIGVVQGKTMEEIEACYKFMSSRADVIALSFDMSFYGTYGAGNTLLEKMCTGRQDLITHLITTGQWNWNKPHHLLGCSLPQEFSYYVRNNIHNIRSVDTSNPIVHGLHNVKYNSTFGLKDKLKIKLADLIEAKYNTDQLDCINYNIKQFRRIADGQI